MFNTANIQQAKKQFAEHRYCYVDDILEERYINELYRSVRQLDYGYWGCVGHSHQKISQQKMAELDHDAIRDEYKAEASKQFGYWHRAKWIHTEQDMVFPLKYPLSTEFTRVVCEDYRLGKPDVTFHDVVSEITGFTNMETKQPSYSYYGYDNWLNPHHDPARWCAYIFYFNPDWKAHWGGQLCIMNDDETTIKDSIEPFGNRLTIMDVSETVGKRANKHFISPVSYIAPYPRYSLAGWFYQKDTAGPSPVQQ